MCIIYVEILLCKISEFDYLHQKYAGMKIIINEWASPVGTLSLGDFRGALCMADWVVARGSDIVVRRLCRHLNAEVREGSTPLLGRTVTELEEYFRGERTEFDLPLLMPGTEFQRRVWDALCGLRYGLTISYGELAEKIDRPEAVRAVANAVGANGISIIVPCHRVVGNDGRLTGYAGGPEAKRRLLGLELGEPFLVEGVEL